MKVSLLLLSAMATSSQVFVRGFVAPKPVVRSATTTRISLSFTPRTDLESPTSTVLYSKPDSDEVTTSAFSTPLDRPLLALVDVLALFVFASIGKASHTGPAGSVDPISVAVTAFPFVISWLLTSPATGVYSNDPRVNGLLQTTALQVVKGWVVAIPLGCVLRGVIKGYVPPLPFVIVTLIATLVILVLARLGFAVVEDFFVEMV